MPVRRPLAVAQVLLLVLLGCALEAARADAPDADGDGHADAVDNCVEVANGGSGPGAQSDADSDAIGDVCDCDLDQDDGCNVDDFVLFLADFATGSDPGRGSDMDASGSVNIDDFSLFLRGFAAGVPGPSGLREPCGASLCAPEATCCDAAIGACVPLGGLCALAPYFGGLGREPDENSRARAISADGSVVLGSVDRPGVASEAVIWRHGIRTDLGDLPGGSFNSSLYDASADGSTLVGHGSTADGYEPIVWTQEGGMRPLGPLPSPFTGGGAGGVSADGRVVVGGLHNAAQVEAFRWTATEGFRLLGDLAGGAFRSGARAVSADGRVVLGTGTAPGYGSSSSGSEPFLWSEASGLVGLGGSLGCCINESVAVALSADGTVVVVNDLGVAENAYRWTAATGRTYLDAGSEGFFDVEARSASDDASVIVGLGWVYTQAYRDWIERYPDVPPPWSLPVSERKAFRWLAGAGTRSLASILAEDHGIDLAGWTLEEATGVSADGRTIVGWGRNPAGLIEGWIPKLP